MFLESPFAGNHPKLIQKGTKAAAADAAEVASESEAAAQQEQTERQASEFEALGAALTPRRSRFRSKPPWQRRPPLQKPLLPHTGIALYDLRGAFGAVRRAGR
jgi:hypothetical protein